MVPTDVKEAWIRELMGSGLDMVQVGSFVHPEKVPQMADSDELFRRLVGRPRAPGRAERPGAERAGPGAGHGLRGGTGLLRRVRLGHPQPEEHRHGQEEAQRRIIATAKAAVAAGKKVQVSVQSAFGCGFEGRVPDERVLDIVRAYVDAGLLNISLADTAGHAYPEQVKRLFGAALILGPVAVDRALPRHLRHGHGQRLRGHGGGRGHLRDLLRRPRGLPLHQGGRRQRGHRGPGPRPAARRPAPGHPPGRAGGDRQGRSRPGSAAKCPGRVHRTGPLGY